MRDLSNITDEEMNQIIDSLTPQELEVFEIICKKQRELCAVRITGMNTMLGDMYKDVVLETPSPFVKKEITEEKVSIGIMSDGTCNNCGICPLGKCGSALRCTEEELKEANVLTYRLDDPIDNCKFYDCALNSGKGACISTLTKGEQCISVPEQFKQ